MSKLHHDDQTSLKREVFKSAHFLPVGIKAVT